MIVAIWNATPGILHLKVHLPDGPPGLVQVVAPSLADAMQLLRAALSCQQPPDVDTDIERRLARMDSVTMTELGREFILGQVVPRAREYREEVP